MNLVMRGNLLDRSLPLDRLQGNLRLPLCAELPPLPFHLPPSQRQRILHLRGLSEFWGPLHIEKLLFGFGFVESRRPIKRPTHRTLPEAVQLIALSPVQVWFPHAVNFPVFTEVFEISEVASNETRSIGRAQCGGCILC